jgi:hypothetical protein
MLHCMINFETFLKIGHMEKLSWSFSTLRALHFSCKISIIFNIIKVVPRELLLTQQLRKVQDRSSQHSSNLDRYDAIKNNVFSLCLQRGTDKL